MKLIELWRGLWRGKESESEVEPPLRADEDPFVEIAMSASISPQKRWVITRDAFDRMLAELHPA